MAENRGISVIGLIIAAIIGAAAGAAIATYFANRQNALTLGNHIQSPATHPMPSYTSSTLSSMGVMSGTGTRYNNKEKWKIVRNDKGDIDSIEVMRDANIDNT